MLPGKAKGDTMKKKVLFICTHNSARSQMAEAFLNTVYGDCYKAYSAGTEPSAVNLYAVAVMAESGIDISKNRSKSIKEFQGMIFDYVVTVCDHAKETCPFFPGGVIIHKGFEDPSSITGTEEEILTRVREIRDEIKEWIRETFAPEC